MNIEYKGETATVNLEELECFMSTLGLFWNKRGNNLTVWGENTTMSFTLDDHNKNEILKSRFAVKPDAWYY